MTLEFCEQSSSDPHLHRVRVIDRDGQAMGR